jgi:large subunit ribosomal protein L17
MRHQKSGRKLGRNASHRKAIFGNMVTSLFKFEQIETTESKAKELQPVAEKLITLAKRGDLHARRQAFAFMRDKAVTHKLFEDLKERFLDRQGGYTRILKKAQRKGDGAAVSIIQLIPEEEEKKKPKKRTKSKKAPDKKPRKDVKESESKKETKEPEKKEQPVETPEPSNPIPNEEKDKI